MNNPTKRYQHLFFDLDHTLWDTETNATAALAELYQLTQLQSVGIPSVEAFTTVYKGINHQFWEDYAKGLVSKQTLKYKRFYLTLLHFGVKNYDLSYKMNAVYAEIAPRKTALMPHALEMLHYLNARYTLSILTNGFEEIQFIKLKSAQLLPFFKWVITAEQAGHKKPATDFFNFALQKANAHPHQALMIGDNLEADIKGAKGADIDQVFYNPSKLIHNELVKYEISSLIQLKEFL